MALDTLLKDAFVQYEIGKVAFAKFTFIQLETDQVEESKNPLNSLLKPKEDNSPHELELSVLFEGEKKIMFSGIVKSVVRELDNHINIVKIECKDKAHFLTLPYKMDDKEAKDFNNKKLRDKFKFFLNKFKVTMDDTVLSDACFDEMLTYNNNSTPWEYMNSFLDAVGYLPVTRENTIVCTNLHQLENVESYVAENGINVFSFSGKMDESKRIKKYVISSWDSDKQQEVKVESKENKKKGGTIEEVKDSKPVYTLNTQLMITNAKVFRSNVAAFQGKVNTVGNLLGRCGTYLKFQKVNPDIDNELILITQETHNLENGCWRTEYAFGLESAKSAAENTAAKSSDNQAKMGNVNTVNGLHIGIVTQIESDPNNDFRIRVKMPVINAQGDGVWARMTNLFAGDTHGSFFIPNVGDEVIVGYLGGNPDTPIILGSVYSKKHKMPQDIKKENYIKGIYTKEGTKIEIDDEKKEVIISTKKGNNVRISDDQKGIQLEDENKNKITLNDQGITIESTKDLILKAAKNITIEGAGISGKSSALMELKGSMIKLN